MTYLRTKLADFLAWLGLYRLSKAVRPTGGGGPGEER